MPITDEFGPRQSLIRKISHGSLLKRVRKTTVVAAS